MKSPVAAIVVMESGPSPLLVSVTAWLTLAVPTNWSANVTLAGDQAAVGAVPVPESVIEGMEVLASLETVSVPVRLPCAVGLNETVMLHDAATATEVPQLFV